MNAVKFFVSFALLVACIFAVCSAAEENQRPKRFPIAYPYAASAYGYGAYPYSAGYGAYPYAGYGAYPYSAGYGAYPYSAYHGYPYSSSLLHY